MKDFLGEDSGSDLRSGTWPSISGVLQRWWTVAIFSLAGSLAGFFGSLAQDEVYASSATLYVTAGSGTDSDAVTAYQGTMASQQRVQSYADLVTSESVVEGALRSSDLDLSKAAVREALTASAEQNTVLLTITAESTDPGVSTRLANGAANSLTTYVASLEEPAGGGDPLAKLTLVSPAEIASEPVSPHTNRNVALGFVVGLVAGTCVVLAWNRLDTTLKDEADVEKVAGSPVLGVIPAEQKVADDQPIDFSTGATPAAEAYRRLRANLEFASVDKPTRRILVTSPSAGEGKSTTAINVAAALAESGKSVVVVDGDLRRPSIARLAGVNPDIGLTSLLRDGSVVDEMIQESGIEGMAVLASGPIPPNPVEVLGSRKAKQAIDALEASYDVVVIDTPPVLPVTDAAVLAQYVDGVLLIVRAGSTRRADVQSATAQLAIAQAPVLGVVLNDVTRESSNPYGYEPYRMEPSSTDKPGNRRAGDAEPRPSVSYGV